MNTEPKPEAATTSREQAPEGSGGDREVPALPARVAARLRATVWLPVVGKATGALAGMAVLAAVGAASTLQGPGVDPTPPSHAEARLGGAWLAPIPHSPRPRAEKPVGPTPSARRPTAQRPGSSRPGGAEGVLDEAVPSTSSSVAPSEAVEGATPEAAEVAAPAESRRDGDTKAPAGVTADGKIVLNVASEVELRRLPHVGPKRARAIVELRARLGRFRRLTDLLRVKGIGVKTLRKMLPHLVLDAPAPDPG